MSKKITGYVRDAKISKMLDISPVTIWRLRRDGRFPRKIKLAPNVMATPIEAVEEWMQDPQGWTEKKGVVE